MESDPTNNVVHVLRTGTLKIVSSGYADRFVQSSMHIQLTCNGIRYRVDNLDDAPMAYLHLTRQELTDDTLREAITRIQTSPMRMFITARNVPLYDTNGRVVGYATKTFQSTTDRLLAGIAHAIQASFARNVALAEQLTEDEWHVIYESLEAINRKHQKRGAPIVPYK
jgi:hypothetical protein